MKRTSNITHTVPCAELPNTQKSVTISELLPGRRYNVRVHEVSPAGEDTLILTTTQTTGKSMPSHMTYTSNKYNTTRDHCYSHWAIRIVLPDCIIV